jgi:hypothetical protein
MFSLLCANMFGIVMIVVLPAGLTIVFSPLLSRIRRLKVWRSAIFWATLLLITWNFYALPLLGPLVDAKTLWYWVCAGFTASAMLKAFAIHLEHGVQQHHA